MTRRRGFVMLTILWVLTVAAVVTLGAELAGRDAVLSGSNRVRLERARWIAAGCARRAQAAIDDALRAASSLDEATIVWRRLGSFVETAPQLDRECLVWLSAAGTALDVNDASEETLAALFAVTGTPAPTEVAAAVLDWRDGDDVPRAGGAEREWYERGRRFRPRNGPFASVAELRRVRGLERGGAWESLLSVEPGRVSLATAPAEVLMSVPGITRETAERIVERREEVGPLSDLLAIVGSLGEASASALAARYPEASRATTAEPDAWIIHSRVAWGASEVAVTLEWRVIRSGRRGVVVVTRSDL